ncbi:efflux RND transporter permease subunit, partial [Escherichia coli]|nr:efflux RND transporter permease subunit [Escherichia coli]
SLVRAEFTTGPTAVLSYNTYPAIEVAIEVASSASSGTVLKEVEALAKRRLPSDYAVEWTDVAFQEKVAGGYAPLIFGLGVLMIFLLLAG